LFRDGKTVEIDHGEQRYTLRVTRDNKLILTK
jgi:hemin uptake protein HemP